MAELCGQRLRYSLFPTREHRRNETVPQEGEFGNNAWLEESWKEAGNTNVWTWMSADPELLFAVQGPHAYGLRSPAGERAGLRAVTREPMLRAFDKRTGSLLAEIELPANAGGSPMTYRVDGRQYIVVATLLPHDRHRHEHR
jgi:glucose dehydrogenase